MDQVGVQLYTLRTLMDDDAAGTLARVAEAGYANVETAGLYGHAPAAFRAMLDAHGLHAPAGHYGLDALRGEERARTIETAHVLGHRYVVVPWIAESERRSLDGYRRVADELNEIGTATHRAGLRLAYHNHAFEFEPLAGEVPYDLLLEATDSDLVDMELDLFWTVVGGHDPAAYFEAHPGRFPLWHVKDRAPDGTMTDVGAGTIDFAALLARADRAGLRHPIVEHDRPERPLHTVRASYAHLRELLN